MIPNPLNQSDSEVADGPDAAAPRPDAASPGGAPADEAAVGIFDPANLRDSVVAVLKTVYDPEIPVNIYELGMIYDIAVSAELAVDVKMTLTSPACPVAGTLPGEVERKVASLAGVRAAKVNLVWDPPWTPDMMTDAAKLRLNML